MEAHAASVERRERAIARMKRMTRHRTREARRYLFLRLRIGLVGVALLGALGVVGWRAYDLEIEQGDELRRLAEEQYLYEIELPGKRGAIYDANGAALAISIDVDSVYATPNLVDDPAGTAAALSPLLGLDADKIREKLEAGRKPGAPGRHFTWLKRRVAPSVAAAVARLALPGVGLTPEPKRFYPARELAAHVLGFAGVDGDGLDGLERVLDARLAGRPGEVPGLRDAFGRFVSTDAVASPDALEGDSVSLTLDRSLQFVVERELTLAVERTRAAAASVVVLDAATGDILAMANLPTYNPNAPDGADAAARRNRAVADAYEPGSVFKPFLVGAALEAGVVKPTDTFHAENGSMRVGKHVIHDAHPYGLLTVAECIAKSSNICMAKIARKLGAVPYGGFLARLGFGVRPGTGLPGESAGILRPPERWRDIDLATIGFGQGISVSLLQLAAAYGAIAGGGVWHRPRIIASTRAADGAAAAAPLPVPSEPGVRVFSAATAAALTEMLVAAAGPKGTGRRAMVPGYVVAGKTGTAQKVDLVSGGYLDDHFVSSFVGFVPADAPRYVIAVAIDDPVGEHLGGVVAAPVFHEIARLALQYAGVPPSMPLRADDLRAAAAPVPPGGKGSGGPGAGSAAGLIGDARAAARGPDAADAALAAEADALMEEAEAADVMLLAGPGEGEGETGDGGGDDGGRGAGALAGAHGAAAAVAGPPVPDFTGLSVRAAATLASALGLEIEVDGTGVAVMQFPAAGAAAPDGRKVRVTFRPPA
jgi:cell division protein FtsI (penicillin-binding protein 3)